MNKNTNIKEEIMKIENDLKDKNNSKKELNKFLNNFKGLITRFNKNKEKVKILIPIAILSTILMIYMIINTFISIKTLNRESNELYNIKYFNTKILENSDYTKNYIKTVRTIDELINHEIELSEELEKYNNYLSKLQEPYSNLMKHLFLPQLNIRKNPFTKELDTGIIGIKFLEKNPYNDIKLIQKWGDFIKNVGNNNEFNQVESIIIGDIVEENENFYIPINIKFIANSKRSFLLLVEKLSTTSNQKNISLINEFMYNLRENIKNEKSDTIENISKNHKTGFSNEQIIGYHLYQWILEDKENKLIDNDLINKTIKDTVVCGDEENSYCFYKFRDKYRSIPTLAYTVGIDENKNKTNNLKDFLKALPPIIKIDTFTFDRNLQQNIKNYENMQYKGELQMKIYGKGINNEEVQEISNNLGSICIGTKLNPSSALKKIDDTLISIGNIIQVDTFNTSNLRELQKIIGNIEKDYNKLTNYKKIIKLFEIYRMLKDGNLCDL